MLHDSDDYLALLRMAERLDQFHSEAQEKIWKRVEDLKKTKLKDFKREQLARTFKIFANGFLDGLSFGIGEPTPLPKRLSYPFKDIKSLEPLLEQAIYDHCRHTYSGMQLSPNP